MTAPSNSITQEEKLQRGISKIIANLVIDQNASNDDIASGLYRPINNTASLIMAKVIRNAKKATEVATTKPSRSKRR